MSDQPRTDFTSDEIVEGIRKAIADHDVHVVPDLIKLLATKDPRRAQQVLDTLEVGLVIARERDGGS